MYAITLGAAYTLHMDHEIGSIEIGNADFAILEDDPFESNPTDSRIFLFGALYKVAEFSRQIIYRERHPCYLNKRIFGWENYTHQQLTSSLKWKESSRTGQ